MTEDDIVFSTLGIAISFVLLFFQYAIYFGPPKEYRYPDDDTEYW